MPRNARVTRIVTTAATRNSVKRSAPPSSRTRRRAHGRCARVRSGPDRAPGLLAGRSESSVDVDAGRVTSSFFAGRPARTSGGTPDLPPTHPGNTKPDQPVAPPGAGIDDGDDPPPGPRGPPLPAPGQPRTDWVVWRHGARGISEDARRVDLTIVNQRTTNGYRIIENHPRPRPASRRPRPAASRSRTCAGGQPRTAPEKRACARICRGPLVPGSDDHSRECDSGAFGRAKIRALPRLHRQGPR